RRHSVGHLADAGDNSSGKAHLGALLGNARGGTGAGGRDDHAPAVREARLRVVESGLDAPAVVVENGEARIVTRPERADRVPLLAALGGALGDLVERREGAV